MAAALLTKLFKRPRLSVRGNGDELVAAIQRKDEAAVRALLAPGGTRSRRRVNAASRHGQTPLCAAVTYMGNNHGVIEALLDAGAKIDRRGGSGDPPLVLAVVLQNAALVDLLLRHGADPNVAGAIAPERRTPLVLAIQYAEVDMVSALLAHGADPDLGKPLVRAMATNQAHQLFFMLTDHGADVLCTNDSGHTLLHLAVAGGHERIVAALLDKHRLTALVNDQNNTACSTPLMMLVCGCHDEPACCHHAVATRLIAAGADLNLVSDAGAQLKTALCQACSSGSLQLVKLYIEHGAKLHVGPDPVGAMHHVKHRANDRNIMRYMAQVLLARESPRSVARLGRVAFTYAVDYGLHDVLTILLAHNPDANFWSHPAAAGSKTNPSTHALRRPVDLLDFTTARLLLEHNIDVNAGLLEQWKEFRKLPPSVQTNHHSRYQFCHTPLNVAVQSAVHRSERADRLKFINILLYYGADCNIPGLYFTPLHALMENFGSTSDDVIVTVKLMVLCGLDVASETWLLEKLHPGVPLGGPQLRTWLLENITSPLPLKHRCIRTIRMLFQSQVVKKIPLLPLPRILKDYILLNDLFHPDWVEV